MTAEASVAKCHMCTMGCTGHVTGYGSGADRNQPGCRMLSSANENGGLWLKGRPGFCWL